MNNQQYTRDELESVIKLETKKPGERNAKQITSLSADTIKREYPQYVKQLSPRRQGIKLRHALQIADEGQSRSPRRRAIAIQSLETVTP